MTLPLWPLFALLGAVVGSFLNVVADRLPAGRSLISPPSHCPACERRLSPLELVPIVSYLLLRGRCRTCGALIPARVPLVELTTALVFTAAGLRYGLSLRAGMTCLFAALLITMAVIDLERQLIPNKIVFPAIALALLALPFAGWTDPVAALLGGAISFGTLFAIAALAAGGMGMGDVKLAAYLGLILGFPQIVPGLLLAFIAGGAVAGGLLLSGRLQRGDPVPFGPFLAASGVLFLFYGDRIVHFWLQGASLWN